MPFIDDTQMGDGGIGSGTNKSDKEKANGVAVLPSRHKKSGGYRIAGRVKQNTRLTLIGCKTGC
jgi:hypothetical protein